MTLRPLRIGNVTIPFPVLLAPMAGYTDTVMRTLCMRFGCGMVFTEVTNAEGLLRGSHQSLHLLETAPEEHPIAGHIYGSNPDSMARAAAMIATLGRFDTIDINCGCPVRKIVAKGSGVALMKDPAKIGAIIRAIRAVVPLPVTVKTRIGLTPDKMNVSEVAQAVEEAGGSAISIHARFASGRHSGELNFEALARVKSERSIPVIGNGGVRSAADVSRMISETGVDGVMIGRGAMGNPWIFREIACQLSGQPCQPHSMDEHRAMILEHLSRLIAHKELEYSHRKRAKVTPEAAACLHFRATLIAYLRGFRGNCALKRRLQTMLTVHDVVEAVEEVIALERSEPSGFVAMPQ